MPRIKSYLKDTHPHLRSEWDEQKNEKSFDSYATNSHAAVWWICALAHSYPAIIANRAKGQSCGFCAGKKVLTGFNDVLSQRPDLAAEWDESNELRPDQVHSGSHQKIKWRCSRGHRWSTSVVNRNSAHNQNGCPTCSGNVLLAGFNDLFTLKPELREKWHPSKNSVAPETVRIDDARPMWWKCSRCDQAWQRKPGVEARRRTTLCSGCLRGTSAFEQSVFAWLEETFPEETITFNSKALIGPYEIDAYFPARKLGIELNGDYWHSSYNLKKRGFESDVKYHENKLELANKAGLRLAFLWQEDWEKNPEKFKALMLAFLEKGVLDQALERLESSHGYEGPEKQQLKAQVKQWAKSNSVTVQVNPSPLGEVFTFNAKVSLILSPQARASEELRKAQRESKAKSVSLYYWFPWEDLAKLLSHLEGKLGLHERVFAAKKLTLKEIPNAEADEFVKQHHLQGAATGAQKVSFGLFAQDELIAVQQYSRYRFSGKVSDHRWEGLRLCFKTGVRIHGGATRLQKFFVSKYKPREIVSYVSLSHSDGEFKKLQGFEEVDAGKQAYMWVLQESQRVTIVDKDGVVRESSREKTEQLKFLNPNRVAGAFGKGVGNLFFGGKLGTRKELASQSENGELTHNDAILEALGYVKQYTPGQSKWALKFPDLHQY